MHFAIPPYLTGPAGAAALAALFTLAACAPGNVMLSQQETVPNYSPGDFAYAGADRDFRVQVIGNPFGTPQDELERAVTAAMQGRPWGPPTNFTTTPGESARESYHVVMLFNPPRSLSAARLCRGGAESMPPEPGRETIILFGAFCRDGSTRTSVKGNIGGASGPDDPAFRELVGQVTYALFPPDRNIGRDRDDPFLLMP